MMTNQDIFAVENLNPVFVLYDRKGNSHEYRVTPHEPITSMGLAHKLAKASLKPLFTFLLEGIAASVGAGKDVASAVAGLDLSQAAGIVAEAFGELDPDVQRAVLAHTYRDGQKVVDPVVFNESFRANYGELYLLLMRVIHINGFVPLDYAFSRLTQLMGDEKAMAELTAKLGAMMPEKAKDMAALASKIEQEVKST